MPVYGHGKESAEFAGVRIRGACDFPELFVNGSVHMWLKWRHSLLLLSPNSLMSLEDWLC